MSGLTAAQRDVLLRPINENRIREADGQSYLPQQDVRAHLTRIFGFGGYATDVTLSELVFEEKVPPYMKNGREITDRWDVCYRAVVRLTIFDRQGEYVTHYEDTSTGDAQKQLRLAAHDLALKSAVSTALKRAATNLGDQFGLSLYNKGQTSAFVKFLVREETATPTEVPAATDEDTDPTRQAEPEGSDHGDTPETRMAAEQVPAEQVPVSQPAYDGSHGDPQDAPPPLPQTRAAEGLPSHRVVAWMREHTKGWTDQQRQDYVAGQLAKAGAGEFPTDQDWLTLLGHLQEHGVTR